jgi:hypothetical protein
MLDMDVRTAEHIIALQLQALNDAFKRTFEGLAPPNLPARRH